MGVFLKIVNSISTRKLIWWCMSENFQLLFGGSLEFLMESGSHELKKRFFLKLAARP